MAGRGLSRKQQRWASFPSACPSTTAHCAPLSAQGLGPMSKARGLSVYLPSFKTPSSRKSWGKAAVKSVPLVSESYPYLALPVIHAGRLMFRFECSMVVSKRKLYSLASPMLSSHPPSHLQRLTLKHLSELTYTSRISANLYHLM